MTAIFTDLLRMRCVPRSGAEPNPRPEHTDSDYMRSQAFEFFSMHYLSVAFVVVVVVVSLNPDHLLLSEGGFSRSRTRSLREG